jgi:hypothetical protein
LLLMLVVTPIALLLLRRRRRTQSSDAVNADSPDSSIGSFSMSMTRRSLNDF